MTTPDSDGVVLPILCLPEELRYDPGDDPPLTIFGRGPGHGVGLACPCLAKCHDSGIEAVQYMGDQVTGTVMVHLFLTSIMKDLSWIISLEPLLIKKDVGMHVMCGGQKLHTK